jgi:hypothetical protein
MIGTEFRVVVYSAEWFGTELKVFAYNFVPGNGIPSCFLFRGMVQRNSKRLLLILFHGSEFRAFFSSAEWFGTEFREFSVPWNSRNSAGPMVPKPNGSWQRCGNYRCLNSATTPDKYPLPNLQDLSNFLHVSTIFSKIDLEKGYCGDSKLQHPKPCY